ncbi:MAG: hypothetical protein AB2L11_03710 [Syntrophobacteraceae bacterium]
MTTRGRLFLLVFVLLMGFLAHIPFCMAAPLIIEKNLFSQDRKPSPPDASPAAGQPNAPSLQVKAIQLDGIIICGDVKKALLRIKGQSPWPKEKDKQESPFFTVQEGEKVSEYKVLKIGVRSVSLERDGQVFDVNLYAEGKVLPPVASVPVATHAVGVPPAQGQTPSQPDGARARRNMHRESGVPPAPGLGNELHGANNPNVAISQPEERLGPGADVGVSGSVTDDNETEEEDVGESEDSGDQGQ